MPPRVTTQPSLIEKLTLRQNSVAGLAGRGFVRLRDGERLPHQVVAFTEEAASKALSESDRRTTECNYNSCRMPRSVGGQLLQLLLSVLILRVQLQTLLVVLDGQIPVAIVHVCLGGAVIGIIRLGIGLYLNLKTSIASLNLFIEIS